MVADVDGLGHWSLSCAVKAAGRQR
jgi:hypothetical protein